MARLRQTTGKRWPAARAAAGPPNWFQRIPTILWMDVRASPSCLRNQSRKRESAGLGVREAENRDVSFSPSGHLSHAREGGIRGVPAVREAGEPR